MWITLPAILLSSIHPEGRDKSTIPSGSFGFLMFLIVFLLWSSEWYPGVFDPSWKFMEEA